MTHVKIFSITSNEYTCVGQLNSKMLPAIMENWEFSCIMIVIMPYIRFFISRRISD